MRDSNSLSLVSLKMKLLPDTKQVKQERKLMKTMTKKTQETPTI